jgi:hypothetical protein
MLDGRNCGMGKLTSQDAEHFNGTWVVNKFSVCISYSCHPGKEHFTSWLPIFPVSQVLLAQIGLYNPPFFCWFWLAKFLAISLCNQITTSPTSLLCQVDLPLNLKLEANCSSYSLNFVFGRLRTLICDWKVCIQIRLRSEIGTLWMKIQLCTWRPPVCLWWVVTLLKWRNLTIFFNQMM